MNRTRRALLLGPIVAAGCATSGDLAEATVHDRAGLEAALARWGERPKRIRLAGRIDLAAGFEPPAFDFGAFLREYDPARWGRRAPAGPLEDQRRAAARRQAAQVTLRLPPNTELVGAAPGAGFRGGMLLLDGVHDIVLRDLVFEDARDLYPEWDPLDGARGEWNSAYDLVSLRRAERVRVEHCDFDGGPPTTEAAFGRVLMRHDGMLDITRASDEVEVGWCRFRRHDKTMLIGAGDRQTDDEGRLRVRLHHNLWQGLRERTPRVRYGQVQVVENLFVIEREHDYGYSIGVGHRARIVSERNVWQAPATIGPERLVRRLGDGAFADHGSMLNGRPLDLPGWPDPGWRPAPVAGMLTVDKVAAAVRAGAGAHRRQSS
jgi:pectate lyase